MKRLLILTFIVSGILLSCTKNEPVQTVQWYKEHKAERLEVLNKCKDNPGELATTPNCMNARRATSEMTLSSRKGIIPPKPLKFN